VSEDFKTVTAVAWSDTDPVLPAKVITEFKKGLEKFIVRAGFQGGLRLDQKGVEALAKMPSMDQLRAQLLGTVQGVQATLLAQLNAPAQHIAGVVQAKHDKDSKAA
jgi:large subunit ribosomal protein L10